MTYTQATKKLVELVGSEHAESCDRSSCDINSAWKHGYGLWAVYLFAGCGAASDEFISLYKNLNQKKFRADAESERSHFVETVNHYDCPKCGSVLWEPYIENDSKVFCDDCLAVFTIEVRK